jgi:ankyrin repeat protein
MFRFSLDDPRVVAMMTDDPDAIKQMLLKDFPHGDDATAESVGRNPEMIRLFEMGLRRMGSRSDLAVPCIRVFLAHGLDLPYYDSYSSSNSVTVPWNVVPSLVTACKYNNEELLDLFLRHGADPNMVTTRDISCKSVLHFACNMRTVRLPIVSALLAAGADPNIRDLTSSTPLHAAVSCERVDLVDVLLTHGANVDALDRWNDTPLLRALMWERLQAEVVKVFISNGVSLDDRRLGYPRIKRAYILQAVDHRGPSYEVVRMLVENGVSLDRVDFRGMNALHTVCSLQTVSVLKYLLLVKFHPDVETRYKLAPMDYALRPASRGPLQVEVLRTLREAGALLRARHIGVAMSVCAPAVKDYISCEMKRVLPLHTLCKKVIRSSVHESVCPAKCCAAFEKLPLPGVVLEELLFRK